tara:strand:- start:5282 stop:6517 length:1236 start_codon:yes stop_codon:yes gene_type:complete
MEKKVKKNCIESLKKPGYPVVIVALTQEVEAIFNACKDNGIEVAALCDNETRKLKQDFGGAELIHTPDLPKKFPKARLIIAFHNIQEIVDQLSSMGYQEFYSSIELLKNYDPSKHQHKLADSYLKNKISIAIKSHELFFDESITYLRSLDIMITTKCSMKCESCANLMQYYKAAKNTDDQILSAVEILSKNVDEISEFRVIGGEPLMNKQWADIVNGIVEQDNNRKIFVYTNGTIVPKTDQLKSFNGKNINFYITDYGNLSRNINKLEESLIDHKINYFRKPAGNWVDCSSIRKHNRTPKDNSILFQECCAKQLYTLLNGRLFTCPFIANAQELNAIPDNQADYVDLFSKNVDLKQKIRKLVKMNKFFPACDFCDGRPYDPTTAKVYDGKGLITAGHQTPKRQPIAYKEYK